MAETKRVWYSGWEMQCCGDPFEVGSHIEWQTGSRDSEWFESFLEPGEAARITDAVDHHGGQQRTVVGLSGVVRTIDAVTCQYERLDGATVMTPVRRSGVLRSVPEADGWEREDDDAMFVGYAVDVELDAPAQ